VSEIETCPHCGKQGPTSRAIRGLNTTTRYACGSTGPDRSWRCFKYENESLTASLAAAEKVVEAARQSVADWNKHRSAVKAMYEIQAALDAAKQETTPGRESER
jgi:hypothetical protein